jgi:hypothetical protein
MGAFYFFGDVSFIRIFVYQISRLLFCHRTVVNKKAKKCITTTASSPMFQGGIVQSPQQILVILSYCLTQGFVPVVDPILFLLTI